MRSNYRLILLPICWVLLTSTGQAQRNPAARAASSDEEAVKQRIAAETDAYYRRDYTAWANCWANSANVGWTRITAPGRSTQVVSWPKIQKFHASNFLPGALKRNVTFTRDDYRVYVTGDSAVASFVQSQSSAAGTRITNESRVLHRQGNDWKIVALKTAEEPIAYLRQLGFQLIPISALFVLALLHGALYVLDRRKRSNLYFCLFMADLALVLTLRYVDMSGLREAAQQGPSLLGIVAVTLIPIMASVFVYSVCGQSPPRRVRWLLMGGACLSIGWAYWPWSHLPLYFIQVFDMFAVIVALDFSRVIGQAMIRRQPGIGLIGIGLLLTILLCVELTIDFLGLAAGSSLTLTIFLLHVGLLSVPLCSSLYLAREFVRTNLDLEAQSAQVDRLSEQMLAQEQEKARLLSRQNEQLEQTVQIRTQEVQQQNQVLVQQKSEIEQQAKVLSELDQVKTRFFTNVTHEFRTPLTLILGPAEQILTQSREETSRQNARLVQRNAGRLLQLINQLLDLSKLEAGKLTLQTQPGDLLAFVRGVTYGFESLAAQQHLTLLFETNCPALPTRFDGDKWEKMLTNLLGNAIKFTPAGGTVTVRFQYDTVAAELTLTVVDSGRGIPVDRVVHVFDRFYQGDDSNTRPGEGTGIGLALTKELVQLHGGRIGLVSKEGQGTTVQLCVPVWQTTDLVRNEAAASPSSVPIPVVPTDNQSRKDQTLTVTKGLSALTLPGESSLVLVVEDNADVRAFIRSALSQAPYTILEAHQGEKGLASARQHVPDLVITDLMMPVMDGYALCRALKADERTSHIPVIMLTAKAEVNSRIEGLETGADNYVAKPFHPGELLAQVENLIRGREQLRHHYRRLGFSGLAREPLPTIEQVFLERVRTTIEAHVDDESFSVETLGHEVGMSRMQLHRKLKALLNLAPGDLIRNVRLERAHELLSRNVGTVAEVAYAVGFGNPANFSTSFARHFGYAPSEVRRQAVSAGR